VKDYYSQFSRCVSTELRKWVNNYLEPAIKLYSEYVYCQIQSEFDAIDSLMICSSGKQNIIESYCRKKSRYDYQPYNLGGSSYYGGNVASFKFLRKDIIKDKITEMGYRGIKPTFSKVKVDIIDWFEHEVSSGIMNCTDNSFACAISQYETIFELLNQQNDDN
jgi:hypothetical protein